MVVEWHGCDGAALRVIPHAIEGSTASTKLAYSIPRSNIGLRSSDDAAGDTHAITRVARGTDKRIAAVLHASAPRCGCCAVTTIAASPARVIAVVVSPASNVRHRSRCSTIDCPSTPCAMIGCPSTRWLTVGCETTLLMSRCFPCAIPKRRSMPPAMHAARDQNAAWASDNCCCVSLSLTDTLQRPCAAWPPESLFVKIPTYKSTRMDAAGARR